MPEDNSLNQDPRSYIEILADEYGLDARSTVEEYEEVAIQLLSSQGTLKKGMELVLGRKITHKEFTSAPLGLMNYSNNPKDLLEDLREYRDIMDRAAKFSRKVQENSVDTHGSELEV